MPSYVYKTTVDNEDSSINGCYYIGVRTVESAESVASDPYFGSGDIITNYIRKRGAVGLKKEIISIHENPTDAYQLERDLVNRETLKDPKCLNRQLGGSGWMSSLSYVENYQVPRPANLGKKWYNNGFEQGMYIPGEEPSGFHAGRLPLPDHQREGLRKPRKSFKRSTEHCSAISKALSSKPLPFSITTPWGTFSNYADALAATPPGYEHGGMEVTLDRLKHWTAKPHLRVGRGSRLKEAFSNEPAPTHGSCGFGRLPSF